VLEAFKDMTQQNMVDGYAVVTAIGNRADHASTVRMGHTVDVAKEYTAQALSFGYARFCYLGNHGGWHALAVQPIANPARDAWARSSLGSA
jgi:predicted solute-binding protein